MLNSGLYRVGNMQSTVVIKQMEQRFIQMLLCVDKIKNLRTNKVKKGIPNVLNEVLLLLLLLSRHVLVYLMEKGLRTSLQIFTCLLFFIKFSSRLLPCNTDG